MNDTENEILEYAKRNLIEFEKGGMSSNQIYYFDYEGIRYVLKKPMMLGDNLSPFWLMMKYVFDFSFETQIENLGRVYDALRDNPHIPPATLVAADEEAVIYEFSEGRSLESDEFPDGKDNAYRLGQYIGYNHRIAHENCGIYGVENVRDFTESAIDYMDRCLSLHWDSDSMTDRKLRVLFEELCDMNFKSSKYSLIMVDMSADQFLFKGEDIRVCVDLDAYVVGPVEWELCFLFHQVEEWSSFKQGYEKYQPMPEFRKYDKFFYMLMALNSYKNKREMEEYWSMFLFR
ncbi:MAG: hypothetical protein K5871_02470 [Lachnospiraceae bacterium]|nr:hypothetical protein [Lachnospiraceae bacterium]